MGAYEAEYVCGARETETNGAGSWELSGASPTAWIYRYDCGGEEWEVLPQTVDANSGAGPRGAGTPAATPPERGCSAVLSAAGLRGSVKDSLLWVFNLSEVTERRMNTESEGQKRRQEKKKSVSATSVGGM